MTEQATTQRIAELQNDARLVYNAGVTTLVELADKYNVTTASLTYAKANPNPVYANIGVQAFPSKNTTNEIQRKLYATIKGQLRELGA